MQQSGYMDYQGVRGFAVPPTDRSIGRLPEVIPI